MLQKGNTKRYPSDGFLRENIELRPALIFSKFDVQVRRNK